MDDSRSPKVVRRDIQAVQDWVGALGKSSKYICDLVQGLHTQYQDLSYIMAVNHNKQYYQSEIRKQVKGKGQWPECKEHRVSTSFLEQIK